MTDWISVEGRLPAPGVPVLVTVEFVLEREVLRAEMIDGYWFERAFGRILPALDGVTHWQPLPEPAQ